MCLVVLIIWFNYFWLFCFQIESANVERAFEVLKVESQTEIDRKSAGLTLNLSGTSRVPPESVKTPQEEEDSGNDDSDSIQHHNLYNVLVATSTIPLGVC